MFHIVTCSTSSGASLNVVTIDRSSTLVIDSLRRTRCRTVAIIVEIDRFRFRVFYTGGSQWCYTSIVRRRRRRRQRRRRRRRLSIVRAVGSADADTSAAAVAPWLLVCTRTRYRHVRTLLLIPVMYVHVVGCVPKITPRVGHF